MSRGSALLLRSLIPSIWEGVDRVSWTTTNQLWLVRRQASLRESTWYEDLMGPQVPQPPVVTCPLSFSRRACSLGESASARRVMWTLPQVQWCRSERRCRCLCSQRRRRPCSTRHRPRACGRAVVVLLPGAYLWTMREAPEWVI